MKYLIINLLIFISLGVWGAGEGDFLEILPAPYNSLKAVRPYQALGKDLDEPQSGVLKAFQARDAKVVMKVGSGRKGAGLSLFPFIEALPIGSLFFVVDSYEGHEEDYEQLLSNIIHQKLTHRVISLKGTVGDAVYYFSDHHIPIDMVYWEGEGRKEEIQRGLEGLFPLLSIGGMIFVEDLFQGRKGREVGKGVEGFRRTHQMSWKDMNCWNTGPWIWSLTKTEDFKSRIFASSQITTTPSEIYPITPFKTLPTWGEVEESVFAKPTWDIDTCHSHMCQEFLDYFFRVRGLTMEAVRKRRAQNLLTQKEIIRALLANKLPKESRIPHLLHRVWVTLNDDPYEVPPDRLRCYLSTIQNELPGDWRHIFWCLDRTKIPLTVKALEETGRVEVKELREIWHRMRGRDVFERLINARLYALCCDVIRLNVVYLFGGAYTDFGVQFLRDPSPILDHFDFVGARSGMLVSNGFIGAIPSHPSLNQSLEVIDNLDRIPVDLRTIVSQKTQSPLWIGHGIITVGIDSLPSTRSFFVHHEVPSCFRSDFLVFKNPFFRTNCMGSWVSGGLFGQASVKETNPSALFFPRVGWESLPELAKWVDMQEEGRGLIEAFSKKFFEESREEIIRKKRKLLNYSSQVFHDLSAQPRYSIPHISHRIWVTRTTEVPETHLEAYVKSTQTLDPSWEHFFWCIDPEKIPKTIAYLTKEIPRLKVMKINDVFQGDGKEDIRKKHMFGGRVFRELFKLSAFVATTDILRKNLSLYYGGLYCDMGVSFKRDLTPLIDTYDFLLYFQTATKFLDLGLTACAPNSPSILELLKVLDNLKEFPHEIRPPSAGASELSIIGAHLFNSFFLHYCTDETRCLPVMEGYFINNIRMGSWITGEQNNTPFFEAIKIKSIFDM